MVSPDSRAACPLSGRNSTCRTVQISGTGSRPGGRPHESVHAPRRWVSQALTHPTPHGEASANVALELNQDFGSLCRSGGRGPGDARAPRAKEILDTLAFLPGAD